MVDYFAILELPVACDIDEAVLERHYRQLQNEWHPDRKAGADAAERRLAVQQTSLLNDAYATLKSPLLRAAHLLQLQGVDLELPDQNLLEAGFLLMQMEMRELLEQCIGKKDLPGLEKLAAQVTGDRGSVWSEFRSAVSGKDYARAQRYFYKLQFMHKLQDEIRAAEDRLLGY